MACRPNGGFAFSKDFNKLFIHGINNNYRNEILRIHRKVKSRRAY